MSAVSGYLLFLQNAKPHTMHQCMAAWLVEPTQNVTFGLQTIETKMNTDK